MKQARSTTTKPRRAVFAIHGFSGHPGEMQFLGEGVAKVLGATLALPAIAGHGTSPEHFGQTTAEDWYMSIESAYDELAEKYGEILVIGNSFGANLALKLARHRSPAAVACVSIPNLTRSQRVTLKAVLALWRPFVGKYWTKPTTGPQATEQIPGYTQLCYETIPLRAFHEAIRFAALEMRPEQIREITAPTVFVSAIKDPLVPLSAAKYYYEQISSKTKKLVAWDDPYHLIVQGKRKAKLVTEIAHWFQAQLTHSQAANPLLPPNQALAANTSDMSDAALTR